MPHMPGPNPFDFWRLCILAGTAVTSAISIARHRPAKIVVLTVLLIIAWRAIAVLEEHGRR